MFQIHNIGFERVLKMTDDFQSLLIPESEIDVQLLDNLVVQYDANPTNNDLHKIITSFSERPDSWKCFPQILEGEFSQKTKFIVLRQLRNFIEYKWETLEDSEKSEMNAILFSFLQEKVHSASPYTLSMIDQCIVMILKYEWPQNLPTFLTDLIHDSIQDPIKTKNTLSLIQILAHEISVEAENSLTVMRSDQMTEQFSQDFGEISQLIQTALNSNPTEEIIKDCLSAVRSFIPLINLDFIFQMGIFSNLLVVFEISPKLFIEASSIYGEIAQTTTFPQEFSELIPEIFQKIIETFHAFTDDFFFQSIEEEEMILISRTLTSLIEKYYKVLLEKNQQEALNAGLIIISKMTEIYPGEAFQNCIEFWVQMIKTTYGERKCQMEITTEIFLPFFANILQIVINRIVAPYELLRVEEDSQNGSQFLINVTPGVLYETMRDFLVYSMIIMPSETAEAVGSKLSESEATTEHVNAICWSTGAIGGVLKAEEEQDLMTPILEALFSLLDSCDDDVKYSIISGLVFISGSLKNFFELDDNVTILANIVGLAFSVFSELDEEQQIMIATYFKKTSKLSAVMLNSTPSGKENTILQSLCQVLIESFHDITPQAILITLDCITTAMKQTSDKQQKEEMLNVLTQFIIQIITDLQKDPQTPLTNYIFLIRCLKVFPFNIGDDYFVTFLSFAPLLVEIYNMCTANLLQSEEIFQVRSELLDLFAIMASQISTKNQNIEAFFELCISSFLNDYTESDPQFRDIHVLLIFGHIALKTQKNMPERLGMYFTNLFIPTAALFEENVTDFMDFSLPLLFLMKSIIRTCLPSLISLGEDAFVHFLSVIDALIASPNSDVCDSALGVLQDLLTNIEHVPHTFSEQFYADNAVRYSLDVIRYLATPQMRSSFGALTALLKRLLKLQVVTENLSVLASDIIEQFPGHSQREIEEFLMEIKQAHKPMEFKQKLRNFLVTVRMCSHRDPVLYQEEIQEQKEQVMRERLDIPGLVAGELEKTELDKQLDDLSGKFQNMNLSQK